MVCFSALAFLALDLPQVLMLMLSYWGAASCVIAFESARQEPNAPRRPCGRWCQEIYPYKEERIVVEGLCKYTCMMGGGCGAIPVLVLMAAPWRLVKVVLGLFPALQGHVLRMRRC